MSMVTHVAGGGEAGEGVLTSPSLSTDNVIVSPSDSWPPLRLKTQSPGGGMLELYSKPTNAFPSWEFFGSTMRIGLGAVATDTAVTRLATGQLGITGGLSVSGGPSNISPLIVTGTQPAPSAGAGTAAPASSVTAPKGGNTTGTGGAAVAGSGGAISLNAGAGGDSVIGGINGTGGSVTLAPGAAGTGSVGGSDGELVIPRGRMRAGNTLLTDGGDFAFDAGGIKPLPKSKCYNVQQESTLVVGAGVTQAQATQNTAALQAAFTKAANAGVPCELPGAVIEHVAGTQIPSNCHIFGQGKGRSILRTHVSVGPNIGGEEILRNQDYTNGNQNITLENFEIDGNQIARGGHPWMNDTTWGGGQLGFHQSVGATKNVRLLNMTIHHTVGIAVNISAVDGFLVQGCEIYTCGRDGCSVLTGSVGTPPGAKNIRYIGNYIYDCGDDCIGIFAGNTNGINQVTIVGNVLGYHSPYTNAAWQYGGHGVALGGVTDAVITGNVFPRCAIGGIVVFNGYGVTPGIDTMRINIADNDFLQPGYPRSPAAGGAGVTESGDGIEVVLGTGSAGNIRGVKIDNNFFYFPMGHGVKLDSRSGSTGQIGEVKISDNDFTFSPGAQYYTGGHGIEVKGKMVDRARILRNMFKDTNGRAINGGGFANQYWMVADNDILSGGKGGADGAGGAHIDLTNSVAARVSRNRVRDFAAKMQSGIAWGGAAGIRVDNNDFEACAPTNTFSGTFPASGRQWNNIARDGVLYAGSATAGPILA